MSALDLRPSPALFSDVFGVDALVTPKGGSPVEAQVIWAPPPSEQMRSAGFDGADIMDARPRLSVRKDQVPELPLGSTIEAPDLLGGTPRTWLVDRLAPGSEVDPEWWHVVVHY